MNSATSEMTNVSHTLVTLKDGRQIALLGTAHVSSQSAKEVKLLAEQFEPDTMCVELDSDRLASIKNPDALTELDVVQVVKQKKVFFVLANLVLASYQQRLGANIGNKAGAEMKVACDIADQKGLNLALCDRPIAVTLRRAWVKSSMWDKNKLLASLMATLFSNEKINEEELTKLKDGDNVSQMMEELAKEAPVIKTVLLDERDQYLADHIYKAEGNKKLAVLGAGHIKGVEALLKQLDDGLHLNTQEISEVPASKGLSNLFVWLFPTLLVALLGYSFLNISLDKGIESFGLWFAIKAAFAFVGGVLSLAHPLAIVVGSLTAPFTIFTPFLSAGMLAALVQAFINKPKVADFESLKTDTLNLKGFYKNRITKVLLVFVMVNLCSAVGTWVGFGRLASGLL